MQDAPVALLVDMRTGQTLFARNDHHRFLPASVTKVMTLFVAFELIESGKLAPDTMITMNDASHAAWNGKGSTMFIRAGQAVPVETLLAGIASVSANDASIALAESVGGSVAGWAAMMNAQADRLAMQDSYFATPNGWPDGGKTFTSARDLELLAKALITRHPEKYARYFGRDGLAFNGTAQANHDPISRRVAGADGIKTGHTDASGHVFLGSAQRDGTRLIMVLAGQDDYDQRGEASRRLMEWGFSGFDRVTLFRKGTRLGSARLQDAAESTVPLVTTDDVMVALPKDMRGEPRLFVRYSGPVAAPVSPNRPIARLDVEIDGMAPVSFPLVPQHEVEAAGFFTRIANGLRGWFA